MEIRLYTVTVRHDEGTMRIRTSASDAAAARAAIRDFEKCPDAAMLEVRDLGPVAGGHHAA